MSQKLVIPYPVVVEGKYDKIRLSNIIDAHIIVTDGFGIFRKEEKRVLLRRLAAESPLIVLTDSDGGGTIIRSHLSGMLPRDRIIPLYIPQIPGKERRKTRPRRRGPWGWRAWMTPSSGSCSAPTPRSAPPLREAAKIPSPRWISLRTA